MYLSRIEINPRRRETMRALASPQVFHAALEAAFPTRSDDKSGRELLWRIDSLNRGAHTAFYIIMQSVRKPDFTSVAEQFGWPASDQAQGETREYGSFLAGLKNGQSWRFRLRANPVRHDPKRENGRLVRGKIQAHVTVDWQKWWLVKRAPSFGFALLTPDGKAAAVEYEKPCFDMLALDVVHRETMNFRRGQERVTLSMATFEGGLCVTDAETLAARMRQGIGRAKAYGCGLLTLVGG